MWGLGVGVEELGGVRVSDSKWGSGEPEMERLKGDGGGVRGFNRILVEEKGRIGRREVREGVRMTKMKMKRGHFRSWY